MRRIRLQLAALLCAAIPILAPAADFGDFIRMSRDAEGRPEALEISIAEYAAPDGVRVDLVGVVHVADRAYFRELDRRLAGYPVVLYELVGDPESVTVPRGASPSMVGLLQGGMKNVLGLAFQLEEIDYSRPNMVHADLRADEFADSMRERGESLVGMLFRAWALGLAQQGTEAAAVQQAEMLKVLFSEDPQRALKRAMAGQLADQTDLLAGMSGPDGSTLIEVRNQRALERLAEQIDDGAQRVAIFYGAGHMPDIAERLESEFGMRRVGSQWLRAWDLR